MRSLKYAFVAFCVSACLLAFFPPLVLFGNAPKWLEREVILRSWTALAVATLCGAWIGWNRGDR
jgi:hypothetical protein